MSRRKRRAAGASSSRRQPTASPARELRENPARYDSLTLVVGALVTAAAAWLYWRSCPRDIVLGDTPEFITAAITLGVPHPSGYPLVVMLGHLFSLVPLGPLPFRVNLLSDLCGAATTGVIYFTAFRLTAKRAAAPVAALVLAWSPLFWEWSLVTEVFPLNNLLAATLIYLLVMWQEQPQRWKVLAAAFVTGLAMTNQLTIVLLAPAVLFL